MTYDEQATKIRNLRDFLHYAHGRLERATTDEDRSYWRILVGDAQIRLRHMIGRWNCVCDPALNLRCAYHSSSSVWTRPLMLREQAALMLATWLSVAAVCLGLVLFAR